LFRLLVYPALEVEGLGSIASVAPSLGPCCRPECPNCTSKPTTSIQNTSKHSSPNSYLPTHLVLDGLVPAPRGHILRHGGQTVRSSASGIGQLNCSDRLATVSPSCGRVDSLFRWRGGDLDGLLREVIVFRATDQLWMRRLAGLRKAGSTRLVDG
jgi:hypothetical protein